MQVGILQVTNVEREIAPDEDPALWLSQELVPFFKVEKTLLCREDLYALKQKLHLFSQVDVMIILTHLGLNQIEHTVEFLVSQLDSRLTPLEDAIKFAMVERSGPLAALNTPVAGVRNQSYMIAIPNNFTEIKAITEKVLKPFLLNHVFFDKIRIKPLDMLEEYLKSG